MSDREAAISLADTIAADFSTIPFEEHEARTLALAYFDLKRELAAAREREAKLREKARAAKSVAAAPDYDEEAIRDALWAVVDAALADGEAT